MSHADKSIESLSDGSLSDGSLSDGSLSDRSLDDSIEHVLKPTPPQPKVNDLLNKNFDMKNLKNMVQMIQKGKKNQIAKQLANLNGDIASLSKTLNRMDPHGVTATRNRMRKKLEQRMSERREAEQREAEQREAEQRKAEQREAEQRKAEQRKAEQRATEPTPPTVREQLNQKKKRKRNRRKKAG